MSAQRAAGITAPIAWVQTSFRVAKRDAIPPTIPDIWNSVPTYINTHSQSTQDTMTRGPGRRSSATSVVTPSETVYRPSSIWTKTLIRQLKMMNQRSVKPVFAPSCVVTMSSPEPTMLAEMISPGPR